MNKRRRLPDQRAICTKCKREQEPKEFRLTKYNTLESWCAECRRVQARSYYDKYFKGYKGI
jgi:hypothetical protein